PDLVMEGSAGWTAEGIARRTQLVKQLQERLAKSGVPVQHVFWGSQLSVLLPADRDEIRKLCTAAAAACNALLQAAGALARSFPAPPPDTESAIDLLHQTARHVLSAPSLVGAALQSADWLAKEAPIQRAVTAGARHREIHRQ